MKLITLALAVFLTTAVAFGQNQAPAPTASAVTPPTTQVDIPVPTPLPPPPEFQGCLIVKQSEGHRFRNSMVAGFLTGGIGFAAGGAFGGGKFAFVDSVDYTSKKMRYTGGELQKLQNTGVHVIVVGKKADGEEVKSARDSCSRTKK